MDLRNKNILITSGGMLSRAIVDQLSLLNIIPFVNTARQYNLLDLSMTEKMFEDTKVDLVINTAGFNGGVVFNKKYPADIFYENTLINLNILKCCQKYKIKKVISTLASCAYPDLGKSVLKEEDFYKGSPHESVACHGYAKRNADLFGRFLNYQYDTPCFSLILTNLYGPYDRFDTLRGKAVSGLIKKFGDAIKQNEHEVFCLGDGTPRREWLYVQDAAKAVVLALENYNNNELPLNIGTGVDETVRSLVYLIKEHFNFSGDIVWEYPEGITGANGAQNRKLLDISRMKTILNFTPEVDLSEGIKKTIEWYRRKENI